MGTIVKTNEGSWRAQVRRKGKYASQTFNLKTLVNEWIVETERLIDSGAETQKCKTQRRKTIGDLIDPHISDLAEVGKPIRRSKTCCAGEP